MKAVTTKRFLGTLVSAAMLAACSSQGGSVTMTPGNDRGNAALTGVAASQSVAERNGWTPRYAVLEPKGLDTPSLQQQSSEGQTIQFFTGSVKSPLNGQTYSYSIAGADPTKGDITTRVPFVPIVARITFPDGTVLDPTQPGCNDSVSVQDRFFKGPNFKATPLVSNGVHVGKTQLTDAFQRAEFWTDVEQNSTYHTVLRAAKKAIVVNVNAPNESKTVPGVCAGSNHRVGEINIYSYDALVQTLAVKYSTPSQVPTVLSYNVTLSLPSGCCANGYHSAFKRGSGTQVYAVGGYFDYGVFKNGIPADIETWTHELGEMLNDPFVNNKTPAWGHVGQVQGCQANLEVGDPLTGTRFDLNYNGFTYHPQELAFFDWFFRTPSKGTGGKYSFNGTFTSPQGACN